MTDADELRQAVQAARARVHALEAEVAAAERRVRAPWDARLEAARAELDRLQAEVQTLAERAEALEAEVERARLRVGHRGTAGWWARLVFVVMTCLGSTAWLVWLHGTPAMVAAFAVPMAMSLAQWWGARGG